MAMVRQQNTTNTNRMKRKDKHTEVKRLVFICFTTLLIAGCRQSSTDFALTWSNDIKHKILADVNVTTDSIAIDSSKENYKKVTLFHNKIRTKEFGINTGDTVLSIFYSTDQNFEIVRELCPRIDRSFEGIRYKGKHLGLAEFRFCDGKLKEQGYRYDGDVGIWKEWDANGKVIKEIDYGNTDRLENLKTIIYANRQHGHKNHSH